MENEYVLEVEFIDYVPEVEAHDPDLIQWDAPPAQEAQFEEVDPATEPIPVEAYSAIFYAMSATDQDGALADALRAAANEGLIA